MITKLPFIRFNYFYCFFSFFLLIFCTNDAYAQCSVTAGNDNNSLNICDITNVSSTAINLNFQLGSPTAGGTWKDDDKSGGLNKMTGFLNAQLIKKSGIYKYTYTVSDGLGCTDTAVVTVTIGGYTGVPSPNASICNTKAAYNLFEAFNGNSLAPQLGGKWVGNTSSSGLNNNLLDATNLNPGDTYKYTYSIPAIGTCAAPPDVSVFVTIYRSPISGTPYDLNLCSNELSAYTNFNLNDQLIGEDINGIWTETITDQIDNNDETDSTINIQDIYDAKGPGTYRFTYTVFTENNVCDNQSSSVDIIIEKQLDYTGATLTVNAPICENEIAVTAFSATLKDVTNIPNGSYKVTYTISGNGLPITSTQNFLNNVLTFPIASSNFSVPGDYTITVINIVSGTSLNICDNIIPVISGVIKINPLPIINTATLAIAPVCQTDDAAVLFSGISNLTDGTYDILYNLSGKNSATGIPALMNVTGGLGSFLIPKAWIPNVGTSRITITKITNTTTGCSNSSTLNTDFTVNPLPDVFNLAIAIKDVCQGQPATADLTGLGTLTDISIDYIISGINTVATQTQLLTVVGGIRSFTILATDIPNVGPTKFTITNITNTLTGCSLLINKSVDFTVNPIPAIPVATDVQPFCSADKATVANLLPQGSQYQWFDSATSTIRLVSTIPLVAGNYFVKEVNAITGCESALKMINVLINNTPQIHNAIVTIPPVCQGFNANVNFTTGTTNLTDGNYDILYNLSGGNAATAVPAILNVTGGVPTFAINSSLIPKAGNTTITITKITNTATNCSNTVTLSKAFVVNTIPDVSNMIVTVKDGCLGQDVKVEITGLVNSTTITLSYAVSGANSIASQTIPLVVSAGKTSFSILGSALSVAGNNTLVITDITNAGNSCSTIINSVSKTFTINTIPSNPSALGIQNFCETDLATVANLTPNGNSYKWYDAATSTTALASGTLLATKNYYVKEVNPTTGCGSGATTISVYIYTVQTPTLKANGQNFCGIDKPTILSLSNNTISNGNITWYDAATNGTLLNDTDLLIDGASYYGFDFDTNTNCTSNPLTVKVALTDCIATSDNFFIPDGFSPNGDGINETFQMVDIEFVYPNYTLEIFNRYGNVIFKGDVNKPIWDGKNSQSNFINGDAPTGVYFYIIHYNKDNLAPAQGQLYLSR